MIARSNPNRILLTPIEVAVLEGVRDCDRYADITWPKARQRLRQLATNGVVNLEKIADVAAHERRASLGECLADLIAT